MTKLSDFRVGEGSAEQALRAPEPIEWRVPGKILGIDQSLASTGWAVVTASGVQATGMCKTIEVEGLNKTETKLDRAQQLADQLMSVLAATQPSLIVHETPPIGGGSMRSADSSLMAATVLASLVKVYMPHVHLRMVASQTMKAQVAGSRSASKAEVAAAVRSTFPNIAVEKPGPLNEHTYDAIGLVLAFAATRGEG